MFNKGTTTDGTTCNTECAQQGIRKQSWCIHVSRGPKQMSLVPADRDSAHACVDLDVSAHECVSTRAATLRLWGPAWFLIQCIPSTDALCLWGLDATVLQIGPRKVLIRCINPTQRGVARIPAQGGHEVPSCANPTVSIIAAGRAFL
jgi:hypothetical protein